MKIRTQSKNLLDLSVPKRGKLVDDLRVHNPRLVESYREKIKQEFPRLSVVGVNKKILELYKQEHPSTFKDICKHITDKRPEPMRVSPVEQMKELTSHLNPTGELTGGNYRAGF